MKKILIGTVLIGIVVFVSAKIFINGRSQLAQVAGASGITITVTPQIVYPGSSVSASVVSTVAVKSYTLTLISPSNVQSSVYVYTQANPKDRGKTTFTIPFTVPTTIAPGTYTLKLTAPNISGTIPFVVSSKDVAAVPVTVTPTPVTPVTPTPVTPTPPVVTPIPSTLTPPVTAGDPVISSITGQHSRVFAGKPVYAQEDIVTVTGMRLSKTALYASVKNKETQSVPNNFASDVSITTDALTFANLSNSHDGNPQVYNRDGGMSVTNLKTLTPPKRYLYKSAVSSNAGHSVIGWSNAYSGNAFFWKDLTWIGIPYNGTNAGTVAGLLRLPLANTNQKPFSFIQPIEQYDSTSVIRPIEYEVGKTYNLYWVGPIKFPAYDYNPERQVPTVDIYLENCKTWGSTPSNCSVISIAKNVPNTGKYSWRVTDSINPFLGLNNRFVILNNSQYASFGGEARYCLKPVARVFNPLLIHAGVSFRHSVVNKINPSAVSTAEIMAAKNETNPACPQLW